jgi:hypothetical protein
LVGRAERETQDRGKEEGHERNDSARRYPQPSVGPLPGTLAFVATNHDIESAPLAQPIHAGAALVAVKAVHTLAWFSIEACMLYLLYAGFARKTDRRAAIAAAVVGGETLIFAANGFRCPLTDVAESLGAESGSVTDIYLPGWLARNLPAIHVPLIVLAVYLHGRNLRHNEGVRHG